MREIEIQRKKERKREREEGKRESACSVSPSPPLFDLGLLLIAHCTVVIVGGTLKRTLCTGRADSGSRDFPPKVAEAEILEGDL